MSTVTLVIVLAGFARTLYLRPVFQPQPIPAHLYVHGLVLTSWFVWLWVQTLLVQTGRSPVCWRRPVRLPASSPPAFPLMPTRVPWGLA
jgi:hypothetical protein